MSRETAIGFGAEAPSRCPACGGSALSASGSQRRECSACGTIWVSHRRNYIYDDVYPKQRSHHDAVVARCKQITLRAWLRRLNAPITGQTVLEIGFGGGATLELVQTLGGIAHGMEPVPANRAAAVGRGIPADQITGDLANFGGKRFDLAIYLDSFEHLLEPREHLTALSTLTAPASRALVVLPVADCFSRRLMGRWWPHDLDDHWIFYSRQGLTKLWQDFGWQCTGVFFPWKFISLRTVAQHWQIKTHRPMPTFGFGDVGIWLNFGERGFIFDRR